MVWGLGFVALFASAFPLLSQDGRTINSVILQARAWTYSVLQTFGAGVKTPAIYDDGATGPAVTMTGSSATGALLSGGTFAFLDFKVDLTLAAPAAPTLGTTFTSIGTCRSDTVYTIGIVEYNQSGNTQVGTTFNWTPSSGNSNRATIVRPTLQSSTIAWTAMWCRTGGGETCNIWRHYTSSSTTIAIEPAATGSVILNCSTGAAQFTNTNTSGVLTAQSLYEGLITTGRKTGTDADDPRVTAAINRVGFSGLAPTFSVDSGVTSLPLAVDPVLVKHVCKAGCLYSTVQSAVDAITDASSTKRYTVFIDVGDYDEKVTLKQYVDFVGRSRTATRVRGDSAGAGSAGFATTSDIKNWTISNMTIGGATAIIGTDAVTTRAPIGVFGCNVGIIDGTEFASAGKTAQAYFPVRGSDTYAIGNVYRATKSCVVIGRSPGTVAAASFYGVGNECVAEGAGDTEVVAYPRQDESVDIFEQAPIIRLSSGSATARVTAFDSRPGTGDPAFAGDVSYISMPGSRIQIATTHATRTGTSVCFTIPLASTSSPATTLVNVDGSHCEIVTHASDTTSTLYGMEVLASAAHSVWSAHWVGGSIQLSGGATRTDFQNAETVGGFSLEAGNLLHSGTYAGAGTTTTADLKRGGFTDRLLVRVGDLVGATCTNNEIALDTGGATDEICICTGGEWSCSAVADVTGPAD